MCATIVQPSTLIFEKRKLKRFREPTISFILVLLSQFFESLGGLILAASHCVNEVEEEGEEAQNETSVLPTGFSPQRAFHFSEEALLETPIVLKYVYLFCLAISFN